MALFELKVVVSLVNKLEWISHLVFILNNNSFLLLDTLLSLLNFLLSNSYVLKLFRFTLLFKLQISFNFFSPLHSDRQVFFYLIKTDDDAAWAAFELDHFDIAVVDVFDVLFVFDL